MEASKHRVFYYHADASPFGGYFTHPIEKIVPSHGSSSLAQAGGHASSRIDSYRLDSLVSIERAHSEIYGSWTTLVTSVVEGLNVFETVTADRVVATLSVEHPNDGGHPKVSVVGSQFENLRIGGVEVNPVLGKTLITPHAEGQFPASAVIDDEEFVAKAVGQSETLAKAEGPLGWLKERYGWVQSKDIRKEKGRVLCSLVDEVQGAKTGSSVGHVVHVPEFGNIFLGELVTDQHTFRLTMVRIEMGCPVKGHLSFATANSNGVGMP
jgi:hypothetical protein